MTRSFITLGTLAAFSLGVLWAAPERHAGGETALSPRLGAILQQLVSSGQSAPVGGSFDRFEIGGQAISAPSNRNGEVAFFATLIRSEADEGLFIAVGDQVAKLAAVGDVIPSGERIADFTDRPAIALNAQGAVAFVAALSGGRATGGVFVAGGRKLEPVALSGGPAPDIAAGTLTSFEGPALNDAGDVAFLAAVRRARGSSDAIFVHRGGVLHKLVAAGDDAPGGGAFSGLGAPAINNHGAIAFPAIVEQGPVLGGLYLAEEGQVRLVLGAGNPAPSGGIFAKFSEQVAINDAGTIAFSAILRQGGPQSGVFFLDDGTARAVAATGDPAPGGGSFAAFPSPPALSQSGTTAFVAAVDGGSVPVGVYQAGMDPPKRLAGIGDILPDGGRLAAFARYPAISIGPDDAITFSAAIERDGRRRDALFYLGPPRRARH